jgi:hypothetical protein
MLKVIRLISLYIIGYTLGLRGGERLNVVHWPVSGNRRFVSPRLRIFSLSARLELSTHVPALKLFPPLVSLMT